MKTWLRRHFGRQHPGVLPGLEAPRGEFPDCLGYISGMEIYAIAGRDRRLLGLDFVDRTRLVCERKRAIEAIGEER